ncbi:MAG: Re/Si-specific NAD(P)(+) transhydrogenase subunit alpha [Zetaproteobacteria bacterium]|nr:MAG: Re/Si-specific NAD(P)(+) transhydrogenase subunit alpha [Zetaproteobacteria bacterium]
MRIAIPAETLPGERRVAATPETVHKLVAAGHRVTVQTGAGGGAMIRDHAFAEAGARLVEDAAGACLDADMVLKVRAPTEEELAVLRQGAVVVALFAPYTNPLLARYNAANLTCFALELVPRISRAQSMDVLSSQANIAGYKAVLMAQHYYPRFMPMLMTAAGTVQPARVLVLGAGVAGLQAIATARRLGATVEAFDVRAAAREQVESLGARFVEVESDESGEDAGGYAREMSEEYKRRQAALIAERAEAADIIITTAMIPGRPAPVLIPPEVVGRMRMGSVIVDLAAAAGGNCPLTRKDEVVHHAGVTIIGDTNIPSRMAADASSLYARNVLHFAGLLFDDGGGLRIDAEDAIVSATLLCHEGSFLQPRFLESGGG